MWFTYTLGVMIRAFIEIELLAILLKSIAAIFLKKSSAAYRILSYMTEPVIYPVRVLFSKTGILRRAPIDISSCFAVIMLALLDLLFGAWF